MSQEKTRPTTRVSRNQAKMVRAAPIRRYRPPYENCTTRLPVPDPQPVTQSRTRSGHDAALLQAPMRAVDVNRFPPEPTTLRSAQASPEWPNWQRPRKSEMDGQLARQVWEVVSRPKGKTVLGTKTIFKRNIGKNGQIEKYNRRFAAQGFRQIKGIHYDESSSPTPSQASIRMVLGIAAVKDWELRQLDIDMAYLAANVK